MPPNPVLILDKENNPCLEDQVAFDQSEKNRIFLIFSYIFNLSQLSRRVIFLFFELVKVIKGAIC